MKLVILKYMGISLILTIALELFFAFICRIKDKQLLMTVLLVNTLTNPVVTFLYYFSEYCLEMNSSVLYAAAALSEIAAILTEGFIYKKKTYIKYPFLFSLCANLFSFLAGKIIGRII